MRHTLWLAVAFYSLTLLAFPGCKDTSREKQAIKECAADLGEGMATNNGEMVAKRLSDSTLRFYDRLIPMAHHATRAQLLALPVGERAEVIGMRYGLSKAELEKTNGRGWVVTGVNQGGFGVGDCSLETIGRIKVDGEFAKARVLVDGEPAVDANDNPAYYSFILEDGTWKLDESAHFSEYGDWIEQDAEDNRREINLYLMENMAEAYGVRPNPAVLDGPIR